MPNHPLCEVFGFSFDNFSSEARYYRENGLCPFNKPYKCSKHNGVPNLGVCSTWENGIPVIICPIRFMENNQIVEDTKKFLLGNVETYDDVHEVPLKDALGNSVGHLDVVAMESHGSNIKNFGAIEIQAVYISGNISRAFLWYMENPQKRYCEAWPRSSRPDWLSSIKRLVHQIRAKGIIFRIWGKRMAIVAQPRFFESYPLFGTIPVVEKDEADIAWFLYNLHCKGEKNQYNLELEQIIYMRLEDLLESISSLEAPDVEKFVQTLAGKRLKKYQQQT